MRVSGSRSSVGARTKKMVCFAWDPGVAHEWLTRKVHAARKMTFADLNKDAKQQPLLKEGALDRTLVGCRSANDLAIALEMYADAARQGLDRAKCMLGLRRLQRAGRALAGDENDAFRLLSSCMDREPAAMFGMGLLHLFSAARISAARKHNCYCRYP